MSNCCSIELNGRIVAESLLVSWVSRFSWGVRRTVDRKMRLDSQTTRSWKIDRVIFAVARNCCSIIVVFCGFLSHFFPQTEAISRTDGCDLAGRSLNLCFVTVLGVTPKWLTECAEHHRFDRLRLETLAPKNWINHFGAASENVPANKTHYNSNTQSQNKKTPSKNQSISGQTKKSASIETHHFGSHPFCAHRAHRKKRSLVDESKGISRGPEIDSRKFWNLKRMHLPCWGVESHSKVNAIDVSSDGATTPFGSFRFCYRLFENVLRFLRHNVECFIAITQYLLCVSNSVWRTPVEVDINIAGNYTSLVSRPERTTVEMCSMQSDR